MDDRKNIDELIRDKFGDFSDEPPARIWSNIQNEMAARRRKVRLAYIGWISAAAVVVIALVAGWMLSDHPGSSSPAGVERQASTPPIQNPESAVVLQAEDNAAEVLAENAPGASRHGDVLETRPTRNLLTTNKQTTENRHTLTTPVERITYRLLESIRSFVESDQEANVWLAKHQSSGSGENVGSDELSESDRLLVAANSRVFRPGINREGGWVIGAHLAPGYGGHNATHSSQYSSNMGYHAKGGDTNVGGGVSIQYKTSKRLRFESGVYYSQNGQSSGRSNSLFAMDSKFDYASGSSQIGEEQIFANSVSLRQGSIAMNSEAGVVNITSTPEGVVLAAASEAEKGDFSSVLTTSGEFAQVFDFVEIPLYLRYSIVDRKIGIDVVGGLSAGLVVGNNAYVENNFGRQRIGDTEDISNLNFSGTVGVGVNYDLSKHLSLAVEPRFNYYLHSINTNPDVTYRPYRFGLYTGIYYAF